MENNINGGIPSFTNNSRFKHFFGQAPSQFNPQCMPFTPSRKKSPTLYPEPAENSPVPNAEFSALTLGNQNAPPFSSNSVAYNVAASTNDPSFVPEQTLNGSASSNYMFNDSSITNSYRQYQPQTTFVCPNRAPKGSPSYLDEIKADAIARQLESTSSLGESAPRIDLPTCVENYHNLRILEPVPAVKSAVLGHVTTVYKATHLKDGQIYCLRRIHGYRPSNAKCMMLIEMWKKLQHSNVVTLREMFTTRAFNDCSLIFVYDYYPCSETLLKRHFANQIDGSTSPYSNLRNLKSPGGYNQTQFVSEALLWTYIIQLSSAIRSIHSNRLACRSLDLSKVLIDQRYNRIRINCCGILDAVSMPTEYMGSQYPLSFIGAWQQDDLRAFGKMVIALACNNLRALHNDCMTSAFEEISTKNSEDLRTLLIVLLSNRARSINDVMPKIGARFYNQLELMTNQLDAVDTQLRKEVDNSRLFRLVCKLGVINERPEFNMDTEWSEIGDRYLLKLFRDYIFHQVTASGQPWLELSHVIQCLNKLDAGSPERLSLISRDQQNVIVVSYADLKRCLEMAFDEVYNSSCQILPNSSINLQQPSFPD